jgi:hydroxymethylpyrimidine/phosphomethylpyrimidine kinase
LRAPRVEIGRRGLHGTGCTLAALVAGRLARGERLLDAVRWAKRAQTRAVSRPFDVGRGARVLLF